jgi:hypothetical protein
MQQKQLVEYIRDPSPYDGGLSRTRRYAKIMAGDYPKPVRLGPQLNVWRKTDLIRYQQDQLAKSAEWTAGTREAAARASAARREKRLSAGSITLERSRRRKKTAPAAHQIAA